MNTDEYAFSMGKIIVNLQSLELGLRIFLWADQVAKSGIAADMQLGRLQEGQSVPENAFSNYDSLQRLIEKFNDIVRLVDDDLLIEPTIADLRDMLAHGRIWATAPNPPMQLVKFTRAVNRLVKVSHVELIDTNWMTFQTTRLWNESNKIQRARNKIQRS